MNREQWLRTLRWVLVILLAAVLALLAVQTGVAIVRVKRRHDAMRSGRSAVAGQPDLIRAIIERDSAGVEAALQQAGAANQKSTLGTPPLLLATERGNARLVQRLLEAGADVKAVDAQNYPAIAIAARRGDEAVVAALVAGGADANTRLANTGETPLMLAAQTGTPGAVRTLLHAKADPNAIDSAGGTALLYAVIRNDLAAAEALLAAGASPAASVASPIDGRTRSAVQLATSDEMRALLRRHTP